MSDIKKAAVVKGLEVVESDLALINKQSLRALTAEEVYAFKLAACDNRVDRDHERFTDKTLGQLAVLFVGKTVISDHTWSSSNQTARVYAGEVEEGDNGAKRLILRCYMLRNEHTEAAIAAIEGGILRECSVGCAISKALCSICGTDKSARACGHRPGAEYDGQKCHVDLVDARDAYEVSFVAVPAQPCAGVVKAYGGENNPESDPAGNDPEIQKALALLELESMRY